MTMEGELTLRQRVLNTFAHKKIDRLVFSPRLYYWFNGNKLYLRPHSDKKCHARIPPQYLGKNQRKIYDYLGASPRYVLESYYIPFLWKRLKLKSGVKIRWINGSKKGEKITYYKTPVGNMKKITHGGHLTEYPIKSLDDMKVMKYVLSHSKFEFSYPLYKFAERMLGERGVISSYFYRSPYMRLITEYMGFSNTIIFLRRYQSEMENFMNFISEWDDSMYDILAKSPIKILNFGENIDANLSSPRYFEKYLIPYYEKRVKQFHRAGKYCDIHMDGSLKPLLPFLDHLPFDGLEALTPDPQGDVTLEELQDAIGNKVYLDGLPSILFLPEYSMKFVRDYAQKLMEMFSPNLIVGISDELSPNGDIRKVEIVGKLIEKFDL